MRANKQKMAHCQKEMSRSKNAFYFIVVAIEFVSNTYTAKLLKAYNCEMTSIEKL